VLAFAATIVHVGAEFGNVIDVVAQFRWRMFLGGRDASAKQAGDLGMQRLWDVRPVTGESVLTGVGEGLVVVQQGFSRWW